MFSLPFKLDASGYHRREPLSWEALAVGSLWVSQTDQVWLGGSTLVATSDPENPLENRPLLARWDGERWNRLTLPDAAQPIYANRKKACFSATDSGTFVASMDVDDARRRD